MWRVEAGDDCAEMRARGQLSYAAGPISSATAVLEASRRQLRASPVVNTWRPTGSSKNLTGFMDGSGMKLQKSSPNAYHNLKHAQKNAKGIYQLSIAIHPRNTHVCNYEVAAGKPRSMMCRPFRINTS